MSTAFLVIADPHDGGAARVTRRLSALQGGQGVLQVSPKILSRCEWLHTVSSTGACHTTIGVPDGRTLDDRTLRSVLNRMASPPSVPAFKTASVKDRDYAAAEFQALLTSWLASLGSRVINRTGPGLLAGAYGPPLSWMAHAFASGLKVQVARMATPDLVPYCATDIRQPDRSDGSYVVVAGQRLLGPLAPAFGGQCLDLARRLGLLLASFKFVHSEGELKLAGVDCMPALAQDGEVDVVVRLMAEEP
ncbi:hypothetical protein [Arthrobacter sp. SAFR-044]|uniref:hypothetical protein n=1 Tax=Arthrobacter sp. SAFR-044 TaxID=3387278 RepID=UPI003F7B501A